MHEMGERKGSSAGPGNSVGHGSYRHKLTKPVVLSVHFASAGVKLSAEGRAHRQSQSTMGTSLSPGMLGNMTLLKPWLLPAHARVPP